MINLLILNLNIQRLTIKYDVAFRQLAESYDNQVDHNETADRIRLHNRLAPPGSKSLA